MLLLLLNPRLLKTIRWTIEQFVREANRELPRVLPQNPESTRASGAISVRLVRYYTTIGLVRAPAKDGKEARYTYAHLLDLLVTRRLMADGHTAAAIRSFLAGKTPAELEALLDGGLQINIVPANPKLAENSPAALLAKAGEPQKQEVATQATSSGQQDLPSAEAAEVWTRKELLPGLEIHVRHTFNFPASQREWENLIGRVDHGLCELRNSRRGK